MDKDTKALALRAQAQGLLQEAQALDGLEPFKVTHQHECGASVYLVWSDDRPSEADACLVLDAEFEEDRNESIDIDIDTGLMLEEMTGVAPASRRADIRALAAGEKED